MRRFPSGHRGRLVKRRPSPPTRPRSGRLSHSLSHLGENRTGSNTGTTVCSSLNLAPQGIKLRGAKPFSIFECSQPVTHNFARTRVPTLLNLFFDEGFEMVTDDVA
jgi:hypothetical protein